MSSMILVIFSLLCLLSQLCETTTIVVDGVSQWKNPTVHVGDSIVFRHKYHYNLYIFRNQNAFNLCNFNEATKLTNTNSSSYKWYPSRTGFYYFTFHNGSMNSCDEHTNRLPVEVIPLAAEASPKAAPIPSPTAGGIVSSSPTYQWPFQPRERSSYAPAPLPVASSPMKVPYKSDGMPFINSNPAVPLPTDEIDSASIFPLPANGQHKQATMGLLGVEVQVGVLLSWLLLLLMV